MYQAIKRETINVQGANSDVAMIHVQNTSHGVSQGSVRNF